MHISETLTRIRLGLAAPDRWSRGRDFLLGGVLHHLPAAWRRKLYAGDRYFCPVCASNLRTFIVLNRPYNLWCPVCWSLQRHRFVWHFFNERFLSEFLTGQTWNMLHIAPEPSLATHFVRLPGIHYLSADLYRRQVMVRMDITAIQYPANHFDLIYCSHVLEHVTDDRKALSEFRRVIKPNGKVVIVVPITSQRIFEDPSVTSPRERERLFGQHDHVRVYGPDVAERFEQSGFNVARVRREDLLSDLQIERMGMNLNETIFVLDKNAGFR